MSRRKFEIDMTEGPFLSKIIRFAIPLVFTGILQSLYNAADLIIVGQFEGDIALAAVGSTNSLTNLVVGLFMGLSAGAGVSVAHYLGAKREKEVSGVLHTAILISVILGALVSVIGFTLAPTMLKMMGNPDDVIEYSIMYIRIIFLGMPASLIYNYAAAMLRSTGDTKNPLIFLSISGLVNVALNVILVAFFSMGVAGVAIGTIAAQYLSAVMIMVHLSRLDGCMKFSVRKLKINPRKLKKILYIGIPSGLQGSLFSLSNVIIQASINSFGSNTMSGSAASGNIEGFIYIALNAFYHASLNFVGQNVGAKKFQNVKKIVMCSVGTVVVVGFVLQGLVLIFSRQLIGLYAEGEEAIHQGVVKMFVIMSLYFLCGIMEVFSGALRGMGRSVTSMLISLSGACLFRIVWIETVFKLVKTPESIYVSYPISWALTSVCSMIFLIMAVKKESKKINEPTLK